MNIIEIENDIRKRVLQLRRELGIAERTLAAGDDAAIKRINRQLSHGGRITLETLLNILDSCPNITLDWLVFGIEKTDTQQPGKLAHSSTSALLSEPFVQSLLQQKDKQIEALIAALNAANQKREALSWTSSDTTKAKYPTTVCEEK